MSSLSLLQGIFPNQGSNPGLLHCRQILYRLKYQGSHMGILARSEKMMWLLLRVLSVSMFLWALPWNAHLWRQATIPEGSPNLPLQVWSTEYIYIIHYLLLSYRLAQNLVSYNNDNNLSLMVSVGQEFRQGTVWRACSCSSI